MTLSNSEPVQVAQGSAARASPRSGRGMALTAQQEATLVELCKARTAGGPCANQPKQFWRSVAAVFEKETGRPYSWQSCRRRMTKLEDDGNVERPRAPSTTPPVPAEPSEAAITPTSTINDHDHGRGGEDDDLPATPTVRGRFYGGHVRDVRDANVLRANIIDFVNSGVENFEKQLNLYTAAIIKDRNDLRKVNQAFAHFKDEMDQALEKYKRGLGQGGL